MNMRKTLLSSASACALLIALSQPASAATCTATNDSEFDACVAGAANGDTIILTGTATLDTSITAANLNLTVDAGGALTDAGGSFGPSTAVTVNTGGSLATSGTDVFASLSGAGAITTSSGAINFGNASNTAFSGTWTAPSLSPQLIYQGTGTHTINGMTSPDGSFGSSQGTLAHTAGSSSIKSIQIGTGATGNSIMNMSGGTLNLTGTGGSGAPCASQCPALRVGDFGGTAVLNHSAGSIIMGAPGGSFNLGNQGGIGTYNLSGGTLQLGVFGDVTTEGLHSIGRSTTDTRNSSGTLNISGTGLLDLQRGFLVNGDRDAAGSLATTSSTINQTGGTLRVRDGAFFYLSGYNNAGALDSVYNLNGGTLEIGGTSLQVDYTGAGTNGAYQFNIGNGTIKVIDNALSVAANATLTGATAATGATIDTNGLGATWTGNLSGAGWLSKAGAGTLTLSGTNTFSGGLAVNAGTVATTGTSAIGDTASVSIASGATLTLGTMVPGTYEVVGGLNMASGSTLNITSAGAGLIVGDLTNSAIAGTVNSPFGGFLGKAGPATMTINGLTMAEGDLYLFGGVTAHTAGTSTVKAPIVGTGAGYSATFTMSGGLLNVTGTCVLPGDSGCARMSVGDFGGTGVVNHTGGTIKVAGAVGISPASFAVGNQGGDGTYNISGGVLQFGDAADPVNSGIWGVGRSTASATDATTNGTLNISGTGLVDVQTGDLVNGDRDAAIRAGGETTVSTITMTGGELRVRADGEFFLAGFDNNAAVDSTFNLNGGQLTIGGASLQEYYAGGTGVYQFNFGSGTVMVSGSALTTTANATLTGATAATGGTINTNGLGANWNGVLSGSGWLVKSGAGTLNLGGTNTYTGGTAFNGGTVFADVASDLGALSAGMSFNGGTLQLGVTDLLATRTGATALAGAGTIDTNGFNSGYGGAISGTGALTKAGAGTLTLSGTNTFTGGLLINAGTVATSGTTAIADTNSVSIASGGTLTIGSMAPGSFEIVGGLNMAAGSTLNITSAYSGLVVGDLTDSAIAGTVNSPFGGFLVKAGPATMTINGLTMAEGDFTAIGGVVAQTGGTSTIKAPIIGNGTGFSATFAMSGGVLNVTGTCVLPGDSGCAGMRVGDFGGTGVVNHTGGTIKVAGTVGVSPASFTVGNQGGDGTYNISGGVLQFGDAADPVNSGLWGISRSTSSATDATSSGVLNISGTGLVDVQTGDLVNGDRDATIRAGGETTLSTINMTGGELRVRADGEFFLAGFNNNAAVDSTFNLNGGQLTIGGASLQEYYAGGTGVYQFNFGNGTIMVSGSALTTTADATLTGATQLTGATINTNGLGATWSGDLTGTGWLSKVGAGTLTLSGTNTFSGGLAVNAGEVSLLGGAALADALAVTVASGATLSLGASETIGSLAGAGAVGLGANTLTAGGNNGSTTFSGVMSGTGGLTKAGTGTMTLSGANTYTGATTINAGTLATAGGAAIADTSAVTVASGATLSLGASETVASIAGAGSVGLGAFTLTSGGNNASTTLSGAVTGTGGLTKVGTGTLTLSGTNTYSGATTISAGTLATTGSTAIGDTSAVSVASGATLSLGGSETVGGLSGAGSVALGANTLTVAGGGTFTGATSGTGGLTKSGTGTLSTGNLAHTGLTTVSGGNLNVNGSTAGSVTVNSGGTLSGNTTIGGNLTLNAGGTLSTGNSPGTTTVAGNYIGGGILNVEVQFNNAGAPVNGTTHDFLNITGNVSGVSSLNILAVAPSNAPTITTGNGIELVRVGGTTSAGAFVLSGPVVQGGIQYLLNYLPNYSGTLDGYFLQATARDEIAGHVAILSAGRSMLARCSRGDERFSGPVGAGGKRAWAKFLGGSLETGADTGLQTEQEFSCTAGGMDLASAGDLRLGLAGGFGDTSVDVTTAAGVSKIDGDQSTIEAQASYAMGSTFVNMTAGLASTEWSHTGPVSGVKQATVDGLIGSLQVGHRWNIGEAWQFGVSGGLDYDGTSCSDTCLLAGVTAEESNWRGNLAAKLSGTTGKFRPYASIAYSDDLDGGNSVSLGGVSVAADTASSLLSARAGFDARVSDTVGLFVDAGMVEGLDTDVTGYDGQAGLRINW